MIAPIQPIVPIRGRGREIYLVIMNAMIDPFTNDVRRLADIIVSFRIVSKLPTEKSMAREQLQVLSDVSIMPQSHKHIYGITE